jgi:hypothetical protein
VLGRAGARVIDGELSVPRVHEHVDETRGDVSSVIESRLDELVAALVEDSLPAQLAA